MSEAYDYGPLRTYEITWTSGHIETVQGHQVQFGSDRAAFSSVFGAVSTVTCPGLPPRFTIHGELDGHWRLVLTAPEADLVSVRDVTDREVLTAQTALPDDPECG